MATRFLGRTTKSRPATPNEWDLLMRKAILRAEKANDSRLASLRTALQQGKSSATLKRMGIIGENDLNREFPTLET